MNFSKSSLKLFLFLVILITCCKSPFVPPPPPPPNGDEIVTVDYNGQPVTATSSIWQITLNRVWTQEVLQDLMDPDTTYPAKGKWVIAEFKAKNVYTQNNVGQAIVDYMFAIVDKNSNSYSCQTRTIGHFCFPNAFVSAVLEPNQEIPLMVLVFDVAKDTGGLVLVFSYRYSNKSISIKFKLITLG